MKRILGLGWRFAGAALAAVAVALASPPQVAITRFDATASGTHIEWTGPAAGWRFTVQRRSDLGAGGWSNAPGVFPSATNQWSGPAFSAGASEGYFRVVATPPATDRGRIASVGMPTTFSALQITALAHYAGLSLVATQSVTVYPMVYDTIDPFGAPTVASGALAVPQHLSSPRPVVVYMHGTSTAKSDVPSRLNFEGLLGVAFAASGYLAEMPDYLGLGDSPGLHPYLHAASEASAGVDMLRASRRFFASNGIPAGDRLFVSGYSQGGHAALALLRELETNLTNEFAVTACAAGSGPYDLSGTTLADALSGRAPPSPYYFPYLLAAYQDVYGLTNSLGQLLAAPYNSTLPPLFDGAHSGDAIDAQMPARPADILRPAVLASLANNQADPLRAALRDNDLIRWKPRAPLRLYACAADQDVLPANAVAAMAAFQALGDADVTVLDPDPSAGHVDCAVPSILAFKAWFDGWGP